MGKLRFILGNFWLWATLAIGCMYAENFALFSTNPRAGYNNTTFWMLTLCCFFCLGMYLYFEHKKNGVKFDKILLPVIIGLTIVMLGTIIMQNGETFIYQNGQDSITVSFTVDDRVKYCFKLVFLMAFSYITTFTMFANRVSNRTLIWIPVLILALAYIACFYSIFTESSIIASYFRSTQTDTIQSFFYSPNAMGICLLLGILACFVISLYKVNVFTFLSILILFGFMCLTKCASTLLVSVIIIPLFFIIQIFRNIKKHFAITIITSAIAIIAIAVFAVLITYFAGRNNRFVNNIIETIDVFIKGLKLDSISGRADSFRAYINYCTDTPWHFIFGRGYGTSDVYVPAMSNAIRNGEGVLSTENGFIQIFISFGMIGIFAYFGLLGWFGYSVFKLIVYKKASFALTYTVCVISLIVNDLVETNNFYDLGFKETIMTIAFLMPPIVKAKFINHPEKVEEIKRIKVTTKFDAQKIGMMFSIVLILAIAAVGASFFSPFAMNNPTIYLIIIGSIFAALLFFPYLITLWLSSEDIGIRLLHVALNLIGMFVLSFIIFTLVRRETGDSGYAQYLGAGIGALIYLVIDTIIYSFIRRKGFMNYLKITFIEPFKFSFLPLITGFGGAFIFTIIFISLGQFGAIETLGIVIFYILSYFAGLFLIPNRFTKGYMNYLNDTLLYRWATFARREYE